MKIFIGIIFIIVGHTSAGQKQVLAAYNFDKGGYSLLGLRAESDANGLADTLGDFYTNDISVLQSLKKEWTFKKPSPQYACGYHYMVAICKKGIVIERFHINLNCHVIATDKGHFFFDSQKLRLFKSRLEKPVVRQQKFSTLMEARTARNKFLSQKDIIMTFSPDWTKYEGEFTFTYTCKKGSGACFEQERKLVKQLTQEIQKAYPHEILELAGVGSSNTELDLKVKCNRTLSNNFKLYPLKEDWKPYALSLTSYWKREFGN